MIPLPGIMSNAGISAQDISSLPAHTQQYFTYLKYCVIGMWACAILRLLSADIAGCFNDVFSAIVGTFLLKDDPHLNRIWGGCIKDGPLHMLSPGGVGSCLAPCMFIWGLNGLIDFIKSVQIIGIFGTLVPCTFNIMCLEPVFLVASTVAHFAGATMIWWVIKALNPHGFGGGSGGGGGGQGNAYGELPTVGGNSPHLGEQQNWGGGVLGDGTGAGAGGAGAGSAATGGGSETQGGGGIAGFFGFGGGAPQGPGSAAAGSATAQGADRSAPLAGTPGQQQAGGNFQAFQGSGYQLGSN